MIDLDIYYTNPTVENFLESLKVKFNQDYSTIKVYISTASQDSHWLKKLYDAYNNTELMR